MATVSGLEFSEDGVLTVTPRPGEGVPDTAQVMGGWAADENGAAYIEAASTVPSNAVQIGGLSYTQDGALYVTSAAPSNPVYIGGRAVRQDGALHVKTGTPSGDDQALGGWMTSNAGVAYVDLLPSFWLPLNDLGDGEADITLGMGTGSGTFTRATTATTVDSTGQIISVASGVPRSYYDPTTLEYRGYLAEGARTNKVVQSQDFGTTWVATGSPTRTGGALTLGVLSFDLIGDDSAAAAEFYSQVVSFTGNGTKAISIFVKEGTSTKSFIRLRDDTAPANRLSVNITWSGGVPTVAMVTGTDLGSVSYPNGIYRLNFLSSSVTAANSNNLQIFPACDSAIDVTAVGNIYAGGVQAEDASFASTYIPTTTASVTRNTDVLIYPFAGNASASAGTAYAETQTFWTSVTGVAECLIDFGDRSALYIDSGASSTMRIGDGTNVAFKSGLFELFTAVRKRASSWGGAGLLVTGDGAQATAGAFDGAMPSTAIGIGGNATGATSRAWFGTIRNARIYQNQFTAAQLQAITA